MKYLKTLLPHRWVILLLFIGLFAILGIYMTEVWDYYVYISVVVVTVFIMDLTIGLGRRVDSFTLNDLGICWLMFLVWLILRTADMYR